MQPCPACGGQMELVTDGQIVSLSRVAVKRCPQYPDGVKRERKFDTAPFFACTACEHCEIVAMMGGPTGPPTVGRA